MGEPQNPRLACTWGRRLVLSELPTDPVHWFMPLAWEPFDAVLPDFVMPDHIVGEGTDAAASD